MRHKEVFFELEFSLAPFNKLLKQAANRACEGHNKQPQYGPASKHFVQIGLAASKIRGQ
jgi:hypothetical protein